MRSLLKSTTVPALALAVSVATATAIAGNPSSAECGLPPEALGDWRSVDEPEALIRVEPGYFREHTPGEGTTERSIVAATSCAPAVIDRNGLLEPLSVSIEDRKLVVVQGGVREEYLRLAATPAELRLDIPAIRPSREIASVRAERIRDELKHRHDEDQAFLKAILASERDELDYERLRENNKRHLRTLLGKVGWLSTETFGARTTYHAFMLLQHSNDLGLMLATAPYIERDLQNSDYSESYALFFDRLQVKQGRPQRYGTQMARLPNGEPVILPIEDPERLDERRRSLGLPPLEEYLDLAAQHLFGGKRPRPYDARVVDPTGASAAPAAEPSSVESLIALVESPETDPFDSDVGVAAIEVGPAALPALRPFLALPDEDDRLLIAALAMAYIGGVEAVDLLRERFGSSSEAASRTVLAFAFASTGRPEERALLVSWLEGKHFGDEWPPIAEAAFSLGVLREKSAIPELSAAAETADSIAGHAAREAIRWMEEGPWTVSAPENDLHPAVAAVITNGIPSTERADAFYDYDRDACWFRSEAEWMLSARGCSDDLPRMGFELHVSSDGLRALVSVSLVFGRLDGVGYDYIVRRSGQGWTVQGVLFTWIS